MPNRLIYIVDDEPAIVEPLAYALKTDGFQIETFTLGQAFLQRLAEQQPDLIVLDIGLPDITGFELLKVVKEQKDIPFLFLTARGDEIDRVVGLELGADDYVVKPFSPREVAARIRVIIKRYSFEKQDAKQASALTVDMETMTAIYLGIPLSLTRFEFLILAHLAESPGRVYSRAHLIDSLWPDRSGSMERTIDTHIKTLRSKLKQVQADAEVIKTHRGIGYSLELTE